MILAKLKEATKVQHSRLEKAVDIINNTVNFDSYQKLLQQFYGFYVPVEPLTVRQIDNQKIDFDYGERLKLPLLMRDLRRLNGDDFDFATVRVCRDAPALETLGQTLGCLYVLEGSTLGGQIIGRHLRQNLELTAENGAAFFNSYGERVGQMWKDFGVMANTQAERLNRDDEIIASAQETFTKLEKWFSHSE